MSSQKGKKSDSFATHYEKYFKFTTSHTDLHAFITVKVVKHIKHIGAIKPTAKYYYNTCMLEILKILKNIHGKHYTYEQKCGDTWGLLAQNNFPYIFQNHQQTRSQVKDCKVILKLRV